MNDSSACRIILSALVVLGFLQTECYFDLSDSTEVAKMVHRQKAIKENYSPFSIERLINFKTVVHLWIPPHDGHFALLNNAPPCGHYRDLRLTPANASVLAV